VRLREPLAAAVTRGAPAAAAPAKTIGGAGLDGAGIGRPFTLDKVVLGRTSAGSGHATTALSLAHLIAVLMYRVMWGRSLGMRTFGSFRQVQTDQPAALCMSTRQWVGDPLE
jgi:membrane-associated phospholipid phosphatase